MGGETSVTENSSDSHLHSAFKKLKVDPEWNLSQSASNVQNVTDFWRGSTSDSSSNPSSNKPDKLCQKKVTINSSRMEPYPQDFLCAIEKLSFHSEDCRKRSCRCGELRLRSKKRFNYANSSVQHRPLIRDAKLKLHHSEKDTKQVIRAARLKIIKSGKQPEPKISTKTSFPSSPIHNSPVDSAVTPVALFGATVKGFDIKSQDFGSLIAASKLDPKKTLESTPAYKFKNYRSQGCSKRTHDQLYDSDRSRNSYSDCGKEMRNTEKGKLDDTSVNELAGYFEDFVHIPKKMSSMAEMMYT